MGPPTHAQSPLPALEFLRIDSKIGLSSDNVTDIMQDSEGFLWFTTIDGINRFDGYDIKVYKPDFNRLNSFNTVNFKCVEEDAAGDLWFGSYASGINIFNRTDGSVRIIDEDGPEGLAILDNHINDIFRDTEDRMWIATFEGLNVYCCDSGIMKSYAEGSIPGITFPSGTISSTYEDSRGRIFVCTFGSGLYLYNEDRDDFTNLRIEEIYEVQNFENRIWTMLEISKDTFWLGSWAGGLFKAVIRDTGPLEILQHHPVASGDGIIYSLYQNPQGLLWMGTPYGLHLMEDAGKTDARVSIVRAGSNADELSNSDVNTLFRDRTGVMWLATGGGGVNKADLSVRKFDLFTLPMSEEQRENQTVRSFMNVPGIGLLIGVNGLGFGKYNMEDGSFTSYLDMPVFRNVRRDLNAALCFLLDSRGFLWIGTRYMGLIRVDPASAEVRSYFSLDSPSGYVSRTINTLFEDPSNQVWVGSENGLYKFVHQGSSGEYTISRYIHREGDPGSISGNYISDILIDSRGIMWMGTVGDGLNRVIDHPGMPPTLMFQQYRTDPSDPEGLKSNIIYSIHEDALNRLWIGTGAAGLALFNPHNGTVRHFTDNVGIRGDAVYDMLEDEEGQLWLSTNFGITKFRFEAPERIEVENYDHEDGLQGNIFIDGASYMDTSGQMYFGGYHGFNCFEPDQFVRNEYLPQAAFTEILVSNQPVNIYTALQDGLVIKHRDKSFEFYFTALSYSQVKKNKFSYILEGFDPDWQMTSSDRREVRYTNIPPGSYRFMLKTSNSSDLWNSDPLVLSIRVRPAPAMTWWAFIIYGILILSILVTIYYFLINNIKIKQAYEIEKIERKKEEKLIQFKLRFFTNISHELLTPLSVISCTVEDFIHNRELRQDTITALQRNINRLMRLVNQLLDFRKAESGTMKLMVQKGDFNDLLYQVVEYFRPLTDRKHINFEIEGNTDREIWFDPDKLDKIISNLISNALKYTPEQGKIRVRYKLENPDDSDILSMEVTDSGPGIDKAKLPQVFDRFYRVESVTGKTFGAGIGLALTKSLVEVHKGRIFVTNDAELGAKFTFEIPVSRDAYKKDQIQEQEMVYESKDYLVDFDDLPDDEKSELPEVSGDKKYTLLIVEDNVDFRNLLSNYFSTFFHVVEADNGKQGFELVLEKHPDIVITDVMMPEMNGIELCKQIKTNLEVSHIQVILLTARTGEQARHEGYIAGAESYIPKPINLRVLHTRVNSLLDQRIRLIEKFNSGYMPEPGEGKVSSLDNRFLANIQELITRKIIDPELNVTGLCREIGVSNSVLYRKLTKLTGKSPVEFIRYIRLQNAARLMKNEEVNVSEAAYRSGFNDLSYFSRSFKSQFGNTPKQFLKGKSLQKN